MSIEGQGHFLTLVQGGVHTKIQTGFSQKLLCRFEPNFQNIRVRKRNKQPTTVLYDMMVILSTSFGHTMTFFKMGSEPNFV